MKKIEHLLKRSAAILICTSMMIVSLAVAVNLAAAEPDDAVFEGNVTLGGVDAPETLVMYSLGDGPPSGNSTVTDVSGDYELWVVGGETYTLYFANGAAMFDMNAFAEETILPGERVVVNADLTPAPPRTVTLKGYVLNASNESQPVTTGHVLGLQGIGMGDDTPDYINWTVTDPVTGYYELELLDGAVGAAVFDAEGYYPAMPSEMLMLSPGETGWMNLSLIPEGYGNVNVSGSVTDMITSDPVEGAQVYAEVYDVSMRFENTTNETGDYELLVMEGDGQMMVQAGGYVSQIVYDTYFTGDMVFDFQLLPADATIWGYVLDANTMAPVEDAEVWTSSWMGDNTDMFNRTSADGSGYYSMSVAGGYWWWTGAEASGYGDNGTNVWIESDTSVRVDILLQPEDAVIKGYVTDTDTGDPVAGAFVGIDEDPGYPTDDRDPDNGTSTDGTGYFEISCTPGAYAMVYMATGYMLEFQDDYGITVSPGEAVWVNHSLIPLTTQVYGTVMDATTLAPLDGVSIGVGGPSLNGGFSAVAFTDSDGSGDYAVMVNSECATSISGEREGYEGYFDSLSVPDAPTYEFDFYMVPSGGAGNNYTIMGYVNETGTMTPLQFSEVYAMTGFMDTVNGTTTNESGYYEFEVPCMVLDIMAISYAHIAESVTLMPAAPDSVVWLNFTLDLHTEPPVVTAYASPASSMSVHNEGDIWASVMEPYLLSVDMQLLRIVGEGADYIWTEWLESYTFFPDFPWRTMDGAEVSPGEWQVGLFGWDTALDSRTILIGDATSTEYIVIGYWEDVDSVIHVSGQYENSTWGPGYAEALFDSDGAYLGISFGPEPDIDATEDPTGEFTLDSEMGKLNLTTGHFEEWLPRTLASASLYIGISDALPSGRYAADFEARDWAMLWGNDVIRFSVDNDPPVADAGEDIGVVIDSAASFDGTGSSDNIDIVSYSWDISIGGSYVDTVLGPEPDYTFDAIGVYNVTLTVTDAAGYEATDVMTVTVVADEPPTADAGPDQTVDEDVYVLFDGTGSSDDLGIVNYTWTIVELSVELYGGVVNYTFAEPGTYTVELIVTDTISQTSSPDIAVVTVEDVTAPVANAGLDMTVSFGSTVTLDGSLSEDNVGIVNYSWDMDIDDLVLYGETVSYAFTGPGEYVIALEVRDAAGNSDTDTVVVTVVDNTDPVADAGPDQAAELGELVTFDGSGSSDDVGIDNYTWTFTYDGVARELYNVAPTFTFDIADEYIVTLEVTDTSGNTDTDTVTVRVSSPPVADAGDDQTVTVGDEVTFDASDSSDDVTNYTWTFTYDGSTRTLYGVAPTFTFEVAGEFTVTLTVRDGAGLTDTDTMIVTVEEEDGGAEDESFIEDYWWAIVIIVVVIVAGVAAALMKGRKGKGPSGGKEETPEEVFEDLPPPPDDAEL